MPTSRGPAQIPAWQFRAAQLTWPFTEVAVAPRALIVLSAPVPGDEPASELGGVSADGRTLTLLAPVGVCVGEHAPRVSPEVYQTASTVVVGMQMSAPAQPPPAASQVCAGVTELARVRAKLARPLGTRVLLDVNSGQPLVTWEPPPA